MDRHTFASWLRLQNFYNEDITRLVDIVFVDATERSVEDILVCFANYILCYS